VNKNTDYTESLKIILEVAHQYYENVVATSRSLDTKGSIFIALLGIFLISILSEVESINESITVSEVFLLVVCILSTLIGIFLVLWSLKLQRLSIPPDLSHLQTLYESKMPTNRLRAQLFANYKDASIYNKTMVTKKARLLTIVYWLTYIVIITYLLYKVL